MADGRSIVGLAGWMLLPFAAAVAGARFMPDAWYAALRKPAWNPPNWIFAPVWTLLYTLMGVAAYIVWREGGFGPHLLPLSVFVLQLLVNAIWTPLFFGAHRPGLAFADLVILWVLLVFLIALFWQIRPLAGALLIPYIVWVTFAGYLNLCIWRINRPG